MKGRHAAAGLILFAWAALAATPQARAHDIRPGVLALKEVTAGRFAVHWSPPNDGTTSLGGAAPTFPDHCRGEGQAIVDCGARGLVGAIRFDDGAAFSGVTVDIEWLDGPRELRIASGDPPVLVVTGTPLHAPFAERVDIAKSYFSLGVEHILTGVDHLMFIAGLFLFVRSLRSLLFTVTSFTLAHSLTLAASALDWVRPSRGPVELCIALSILLLAVEATRQKRTWTHRAPWVVAFVFGLLHGFGFASALREVGLPPQHLPLALATFNLGVEGGQLAAIAALSAAWRLALRSDRIAERARGFAVFALGSASVYWCFERAFGMWSALR